MSLPVHAVFALLRANTVIAVSTYTLCLYYNLVGYLHSLVGHALLVLRVLGLCILSSSCESNAREERHHDDEKDQELHFGWRCIVLETEE